MPEQTSLILPTPVAAVTHPQVTVIIPCYNEEATIGLLLKALARQTYPPEKMEILVADGMSTDNTRQEIIAFQHQHPELLVHIIDNPRRNIPAGVNTAISQAQGEYIIRLDAHSEPYPDYIELCVSALEAEKGDNVGGVWEIKPGGDGWFARSIAYAAAHPLGVGDARYRLGGKAQAVDTVPFGSFHRDLFKRVGLFDETLLTNEDYEFNVRVRNSGGVVWFDPAIRSVYYARSDFKSLTRQYFRYGYWKGKMLRRYPHTIRWRQFLPPAFISSLAILGLLSMIAPTARWVLMIELGMYLAILIVGGVLLSVKQKQPSLVIGFPLAVATMHLSWGSALLWSLVRK